MHFQVFMVVSPLGMAVSGDQAATRASARR
jgi:hypothetical protein